MRKILLLMLAVSLAVAGAAFAQEDDLDIIAQYDVLTDGSLELFDGEADPSHDDLWVELITLLPTAYVDEYIYVFSVFESADTFAYVSELEDDVWEFGVNVQRDEEYIITLLHEFGHIITLNDEQYVNYDVILDDRAGLIETDAAYEDGLAEGMAMCDTFAYDDGCPVTGSFIEVWTATFWSDDYDLAFDGSLDDSAAYFYDNAPDSFVSEYAATNPAEDFAETFSVYVSLADDDIPDADSEFVLEQKIAWFDSVPELAELRAELREVAAANDIEFFIPDTYTY